MGNRLHLAKKHIVEYADAEFFKDYHIDILDNLLDDMGVNHYLSYENDTLVDVLINKADLKAHVGEFKDGKFDDVIDKDGLAQLGGKDAVADFFDYVIKNGDSNDDYYYLGVW